MEAIENIEQVHLRFIHPKLIDRKLKARSIDILGQIRQLISENTLLNLFSNYHFQQKSQKLSQLQPIGTALNHQIPIDIVLDVYNQITAKYHFSTVVHILNNPSIYVYILKTHRGEQITHQSSPPPIYQVQNLDFNTVINMNFSNEFLRVSQQSLINQFLGFICLSGFNPPPISQKFNEHCNVQISIQQPLHKDFSQIKVKQVITIHKYQTVIKNISEKFKANFDNFVNDKKMTETQLYKLQTVPRNTFFKWIQNCQLEHTWNSKKFIQLDIKNDKVGMKDWNQMFQLKNSLPFGPKTDFYYKYKFFVKLYAEFELAAIEGSKALVDGKIPPLNPMDQTKKHIYIYDNIFYSIANETPFDHSQQKGEDATPSSSTINTDLINLSILQQLCIPQLHVLHMIVVSYRGYKIIAQCIIPGILTGDHANCSQYGSIDDGKTVETNQQFEKLMVQVCQKLHLEDSVRVKDGEGKQKKIACSPDIKGILGSDRRKYILDLLRLSPRDLNYEGIENEVCVIRPQLVKSFLSTKNISEIPKINTNIGTEISFIPNQNIKQQQQLLREMAKYITNNAVPQLINALKSTLNTLVTDSRGISSAFHQYGVNLRYLGYICTHEMLNDNKQIKTVLSRVILVRSLKHLFRMAMRQTNILYLNETIVKLFNAIFGCKNHIAILQEGGNSVQGNGQGNQSKKKKKKKNKQEKQDDGQENIEKSPIKVPVSPYLLMKPSQLWNVVRKIAICRYKFELSQTIEKLELFKSPCQKLATLRDVCLSAGIKIEKKKYNIIQGGQNEVEKGLPFTARNIIDVTAIPKRKQISLGSINQMIKEADSHSDKYQMKEALLKYNKASEEIINLTGGLVPELAYVRTKMGKIFYLLGEHEPAIIAESSALQIIETLQSEDSPKAIQSYSTLGLYYSIKGEKSKAFYFIYKSINLMLISFGQTHPDFLINISNFARIHHQNHEYNQASDLYLKAIEMISSINGKDHLKVSFCFSALATLHFELGDSKKAIYYQGETVDILKKILAQNDVRLNDAIKILKIYMEMSINGKNINSFMNVDANKKQEKEDLKKKKSKK